MKYVPHPGIVMTKICDVHVLIPSRAAYPACSGIQKLSPLWAATWAVMSMPDAEDRIMTIHRIMTKKDDESIKNSLEQFCQELWERGFLINNPNSTEN